MSTVDPYASLAAQTNTSATTKAKDHLDQSSFLRLMIAQFRNQDPTKPQDPAQFMGQLAQFSTVSGIQDMQASLATLSDSLRSSNVLSGAGLVGREILAPSETIARAAGDTTTGMIEVPEGVTTIDVAIKDHAGALVRRMTVPADGSLTSFSWNGATDRGEMAPAGTYTIEATSRVGGGNESLPVLFNTRVDSVTVDPQTSGLVLNTRGLGSVSINDVRRVT
ncbi:MAG TPA: flagellar hook assembly protein FlgD [Steroidobacteraceae bacterium]|nr:flagellar hook assembly protein FlgD [Steroidobacteraceae bacterium]